MAPCWRLCISRWLLSTVNCSRFNGSRKVDALTKQQILASSGGFIRTDRHDVVQPGNVLRELLALTGKARPRLLFVMTASGDDRSYLTRSYSAFDGWSVDLGHLELFSQPNAEPREAILGSDAVWVGGGSVANLLAVWRTHGLDQIFAEAWDAGVVLGGVSAGCHLLAHRGANRLVWAKAGTGNQCVGPRPVRQRRALRQRRTTQTAAAGSRSGRNASHFVCHRRRSWRALRGP